MGRRVILGPRGELSEGALSLKADKKFLYIRLYKLLRLHKGTVFQASSEFEAEDIFRTLGDVDIWVAEDIGSQDFASVFLSKDERILKAVFVSRISPMKNLLGAIEMLAKVLEPVVYDIYGPKEDEQYWETCQARIQTLPSHIQVNYKGALSPKKWQTPSLGTMYFLCPPRVRITVM